MTDKVQKIKDWIGKEQDGLMDAKGNFEYPEHEGAYHILCNLNTYIDSMPEEPVSEDLDMEIDYYLRELQSFKSEHGIDCYTVSIEDMDEICRHFANWQKEQEYTCYEEAFEDGASWKRYEMMKDAVDATVHIDAGNYPYIPQLELYDYDKDVPLAKEGDKYKVILIKENKDE